MTDPIDDISDAELAEGAACILGALSQGLDVLNPPPRRPTMRWILVCLSVLEEVGEMDHELVHGGTNPSEHTGDCLGCRANRLLREWKERKKP